MVTIKEVTFDNDHCTGLPKTQLFFLDLEITVVTVGQLLAGVACLMAFTESQY